MRERQTEEEEEGEKELLALRAQLFKHDLAKCMKV